MFSRVFWLLLTGVTLVSLAEVPSHWMSVMAQKSGKGSAKQRKLSASQVPAKRFEVGAPISLRLRGCMGEVSFPAIGFSGAGLEIDGDTLTLTSTQMPTLTGNVIAYAGSSYRINSNVAFSFKKASASVTSPEWIAPVIISLRLLQSSKSPRHITIVPVPGAGPTFPSATLTCTEATATPK